MGALAIDVGHLYVVRTELQATADSTALAATGQLREADSDGDAQGMAAAVANEFGLKNESAGSGTTALPSDVILGSYAYRHGTLT